MKKMALSDIDTHNRSYRWMASALLITLPSLLFVIYLKDFYFTEPGMSLAQLMDGTADLPFAYRMLVPGLVRLLVQIYPLAAETYASIVMYLSLLAFIFTFRQFCNSFFEESALTDLAALLAVELAFPLLIAYRKVYDWPALFLFTLGLTLLARKKWLYFALLFPLSCLNKETTVLLTVVFALVYFKRMEPTAFWGLLIYQLIVFGIIRATMMLAFRSNPGLTLTWRLAENLEAYSRQPASTLSLIIISAIFFTLAFRRLDEKPPFLRQAAFVTAIPLVVLFVVSGYPFEIRALSEAFPPVFLLAFQNLSRAAGWAPASPRSVC